MLIVYLFQLIRYKIKKILFNLEFNRQLSGYLNEDLRLERTKLVLINLIKKKLIKKISYFIINHRNKGQ